MTRTTLCLLAALTAGLVFATVFTRPNVGPKFIGIGFVATCKMGPIFLGGQWGDSEYAQWVDCDFGQWNGALKVVDGIVQRNL